jgi:hypothetical protein
MRSGIGRGVRGDRVHVLTGVGDEGEKAGFRRRAELRRTTAAAAARPPVVTVLRGIQRRGASGGWHGKRGSGPWAWKLGRSGPDLQEARAFMEIDSNSKGREREGKGD